MQIEVENFPLFVRLGNLPKERLQQQQVLVHLRLQVEVAAAEQEGSSEERLEDTVDYGAVLEVMRRGLENSEVKLIETLVCRIGHLLLENFSKISELQVQVEKRRIPGGIAAGSQIRVSESFSRKGSPYAYPYR